MTDVEMINDLPYGTAGAYLLFLDLYRPDPMPATPLPAIIYLHGGMWRRGDKALSKPPILVEHGEYIVASVNYRLSDQAIFPAQLHDCKAAVRWLRANADRYGIDGARIGAWGYDAGGHLATLLGVTGNQPQLEGDGGSMQHSSAVQAVVAVAAPSDFNALGDWHNDPDSPESMLVGGALPERQEFVQLANPLSHVHPASPPFLIIHGEDDDVVPIKQSVLLHNALQQHGVASELWRIDGAGHSFGATTAHFAHVNQRIEQFFASHLRSLT